MCGNSPHSGYFYICYLLAWKRQTTLTYTNNKKSFHRQERQYCKVEQWLISKLISASANRQRAAPGKIEQEMPEGKMNHCIRQSVSLATFQH